MVNLKIKMLGNFKVKRNKPLGAGDFIGIDEANNTITFKLQSGNVDEVGQNGCDVGAILDAAKKLLEADLGRSRKKTVARHRKTCALDRMNQAHQWLVAKEII